MAETTKKPGRDLGLPFLGRFALYLAIPAGMLQAFVWGARQGHARVLFKEGCVVEWVQFGCLVLAAAVLYAAAKRRKDRTELFRCLAILPLIFVAREMDSFLGRHLFADAWETTVLLLLICLAYLLYRDFRAILKQTAAFVQTRSFAFLFCGFLVSVVLAQLLGQKVFWQAITRVRYARFAARVMEECGELVGYLLILFAAFEALIGRSADTSSSGAQ